MTTFFRFVSSHRLDAPRDAVFDVLAEAETWDQWWPQIRSITPYSAVTGQVRIRSMLPLTLVLELTSEVVDRGSGVLRASLAGDLEGWAQFTVAAEAGGARLDYVQEARLVRPRLPAVLGYVIRPVLIANHALMMRAGMRGLAARAHVRSHPLPE
ncbi:SRPBCC family protein [Leekyejoonella antrihumi]|uniref:Polyketide cyclase n=1 Tax=Leekyejoonella antrihumi TaxID=1660198 RepID=A0A563E7I6_9MICO|nr:SRPBCC family protein [Leekyejoonella antrihumi]TWP38162.1 polyketide cyclase [Leekyejoonella antrihumi]